MGEGEGSTAGGGGDTVRVVRGAILGPRAKVIHFVRHAQATSNAAFEVEGRSAYADEKHVDAKLTEKGIDQSTALQGVVESEIQDGSIQLVVVSPLTRAIETARIGFRSTIGKAPWIALECVRERAGHHPCDRRSTVTELKGRYPEIDWSQMTDDDDTYWNALGQDRETDEMMVKRANALYDWLEQRPETNIAIVTHSAILSAMFNKSVQCGPDLAKWFENAEMRTVALHL